MVEEVHQQEQGTRCIKAVTKLSKQGRSNGCDETEQRRGRSPGKTCGTCTYLYQALSLQPHMMSCILPKLYELAADAEQCGWGVNIVFFMLTNAT